MITLVIHSLLQKVAAGDVEAHSKDGTLRCDWVSGHRLSWWQVAKKALWDHVRGGGFEATMQPRLLEHLALGLERASVVGTPLDHFVAKCPLGLLAIRLFLVDMHGGSTSHSSIWLGALLQHLLTLQWSSIIQSEWPIFALVHKLLVPAKRIYSAYAEGHGAAAIAGVNPNTAATAWAQQQIVANHSLKGLATLSLVHETTDLLAAMARNAENYVLQRALGPPSVSRGPAEYFLRNLRLEFAGVAGAIRSFLETVLTRTGLRRGRSFSCWDVGAAFYEAPMEEVWAVCLLHGGVVRAFEPSTIGHARLQAVIGAGAEQLALSNRIGSARLLHGGNSTASLGSKGCGLWAAVQECADHGAFEAVNVTTVDVQLGTGFLDILKVDVEGHEWEVVQGASRALKDGRIGILILEYGDKWSRDMVLAAKHFAAAHHFSSSKLELPTLRHVVEHLAAWGYSAYFVGNRMPLPISGALWHDIYEACAAPHHPYYYGVGMVCWLDVAFVHEQHPFAKTIHEAVVWEEISSQKKGFEAST